MSTWNCCRGIAQWRRIPAFSANLTHQSTDQPTAEALRGASDDAESVEIEPAITPEVADDRTLAVMDVVRAMRGFRRVSSS